MLYGGRSALLERWLAGAGFVFAAAVLAFAWVMWLAIPRLTQATLRQRVAVRRWRFACFAATLRSWSAVLALGSLATLFAATTVAANPSVSFLVGMLGGGIIASWVYTLLLGQKGRYWAELSAALERGIANDDDARNKAWNAEHQVLESGGQRGQTALNRILSAR